MYADIILIKRVYMLRYTDIILMESVCDRILIEAQEREYADTYW